MGSFRKVQAQQEKVIDYHYIRNLKNREVRKNRFKRTISQRVFRFFLALTLTMELAYLSYYGVQLLKISPIFSLRAVEVTGNTKTSTEEIRRLVFESQKNAWDADLTTIKLRLESHPWIQSAVIWRELPGTIRVHLTEREPVALVLSGNLYLIDRSGKVIQVFEHDSQHADLPVLTGIPDIGNEARIRAALRFVQELSGDKDIMRQVSEIHYYDRNNTIVYLKGVSFGLFVSKDGMLPMIKKFLSYGDFLKRNFPEQKLIDLRYSGQIVVKDSYQEQS